MFSTSSVEIGGVTFNHVNFTVRGMSNFPCWNNLQFFFFFTKTLGFDKYTIRDEFAYEMSRN